MKKLYKKFEALIDSDMNNVVPIIMLVLMFGSIIYISVNNIKI